MLTNRDRRTKAFWNILSDCERSVAVVGWRMTFSVEPIRGITVAQTNTTAGDGVRERGMIWKGTGPRLLRDAQGLDLFAVYFGTPDVMGHRFWRRIAKEAAKPDPTSDKSIL